MLFIPFLPRDVFTTYTYTLGGNYEGNSSYHRQFFCKQEITAEGLQNKVVATLKLVYTGFPLKGYSLI